MRRVSILIFILFTLPFNAVSAQSTNAGIVQGLWYSKEKVFVGDTVRMYVAIRNNTNGDLKGIIEFFDGEKKLERQNVQALSGRIIESWTDWSPTFGSHTMKATLIRTELSSTGSSTQEITVVSALAEDTLFVDYDTDKDGIGNETDNNDDNDTFTDAEEKQNGTDPLVKNEVIVQSETPKEKQEEADLEKNVAKESVRKQSTNGLEQYLAPSRAETVLSSVTEYIDDAKQKVDSYRVARKDADETRKNAEGQGTLKTQVSEGGFGEVARTDADETQNDAEGFLDKAFILITTLFNKIYTFVLWTISFVLGHPIIVQLAILIGILFTILRLGSRFGRRQNRS